jgi:hypothetical protein
MNVNFVFHDSEWGNIHKANYYLRKRGIEPATAGKNPLIDRAKSAVITAGQKMRHVLRGSDYVPKRAQEQKQRVHELLLAHADEENGTSNG